MANKNKIVNQWDSIEDFVADLHKLGTEKHTAKVMKQCTDFEKKHKTHLKWLIDNKHITIEEYELFAQKGWAEFAYFLKMAIVDNEKDKTQGSMFLTGNPSVVAKHKHMLENKFKFIKIITPDQLNEVTYDNRMYG